MQETVHIYFTNDLHSHFEHWPRVATFLKDVRQKRTRDGRLSLLVDIGDHIDRVNPIAEAFMGRANVALMNDLNYDFATIGNNEGITMAHEDLYHLYDQANFTLVCSNLTSKRAASPSWLNSSAIVKSDHGLKIGILGLTAPFNAFYHLLDWHVETPFKTLEEQLKTLKDKADVILLLSHLGLSEDRAIAEKFPEIDVIMGGHTHHLFRHGEWVNETLITAAGKHCANVGEVTLTWDFSKGNLESIDAYTIDITHLKKDHHTKEKIGTFKKQAEERLGKTVVQIDQPLKVDWFQPTKIMQQLTDTLTEWTKADCGMLNAGLLLESFEAGAITYKDIHRICPHPINPCVVHLQGDELLEVIRGSLTKEFMHLKLRGFGFRGELLGRMVFSNLKLQTDFNLEGQEYVKTAIFKNGEPIQADRTYKVATADTFTFGRLLPEVAKSPKKDYFLPEFIRDLLTETLRNHYA